MAIFSFIGVAAYTLLASTGRLKESGDAGYAALAGMQLALRQLEEDFSQFSPRPVSSGGRENSPALDAEPEDAVVEFTRAGWRNPLGMPRSGPYLRKGLANAITGAPYVDPWSGDPDWAAALLNPSAPCIS
jgi:type II secretion system protein J